MINSKTKPRGNGVFDNALACYAGSPGLIGKSKSCNIQMVFLPLGKRW